MESNIVLPSGKTGASIALLWCSRADDLKVSTVSIPFLNHELIFNRGDFFSLNGAKEHQEVSVSEICSSPITTEVKGAYDSLGIMFRPTGIYSFFGISAADFAAAKGSPSRLFDPHIFNRLKALSEIRDQQQQLTELSTVLNEIHKGRTVPDLVSKMLTAIDFIQDRPFQIKDFAASLNTSSKHTIAQFKSVVGLSPKSYMKLIQVNKAVKAIQQQFKNKTGTPYSLTEIGAACGFYDQSHFIHTFKKYTRMSPKQYRMSCREQRVSELSENTIFNKV